MLIFYRMGDIFIGELCILNFELGYENLASAGKFNVKPLSRHDFEFTHLPSRAALPA
ncbi:MAG: hypothetical protein ACIWVG_14955 [Gloeotrichia echinulata HAB0833]